MMPPRKYSISLYIGALPMRKRLCEARSFHRGGKAPPHRPDQQTADMRWYWQWHQRACRFISRAREKRARAPLSINTTTPLGRAKCHIRRQTTDTTSSICRSRPVEQHRTNRRTKAWPLTTTVTVFAEHHPPKQQGQSQQSRDPQP